MKNRINKLFESKKKDILSVFYTAGFPERNDTVPIGQALEAAGADIIEIGIPFSDPIADGPTIQESNKVALDAGMTVALLLEQLAELRARVQIPIILMGYLNPVLQYGLEKFFKDASKAGVDGLILPDLPLEEYEVDIKSLAESEKLSMIFLVTPATSDKRIRRIDSICNAFIYAVSSSSTTGAKTEFSNEQLAYFKRLNKMKLQNPFLIGFGVSNNKTWQQVNEFASGAIVGSSFISLLKQDKSNLAIQKFTQQLRNPT